MSDNVKPLLFSLADALEIDLTMQGTGFTGSRKALLELFEGYSPTVISGIEKSLVDPFAKVVAAQIHVFGNVGAIIVIEGQQSHVSLFVYDRSKAPVDQESLGSQWSRKELYKWLEPCCKAVYHRYLFDTKWETLEQGKQRLAQYNEARDKMSCTSREAYQMVWG